jgi:glucosamine--fructose-6-phosphate aminotransferase (isomerizing)
MLKMLITAQKPIKTEYVQGSKYVHMCGIFGCITKDQPAAPIIHASLKRLEYRGYDSVGIATINNGEVAIKKDQGKIDEVHKLINLDDMQGTVGIGHTRWATHGAPLKVNAHPHTDCTGQIAVVHNGIIENYNELKAELENHGHTCHSRTDTEVIPHLIEETLTKNPALSLTEAVVETIKRLNGAYALAVISSKEPDKIICARNESPLVVGVNSEATYCASDLTAFLPMTNKAVMINDGELVILTPGSYEVRRLQDGSIVTREPKIIDWTPEMAVKQGYPHFMIKEIHEQPETLRNTLRAQEHYLDLISTFLDRANEVFLVACGTSYHACLAASYMFSKLAFLPSYPVYASEFVEQHGKSVNIDSTILAVSQSGETADTLGAVTCSQQRAATILGLTNTIGSTLTRVSRVYIGQQSGPEIGVAATKTFTSQLSVLAQLAFELGNRRGKVSQDEMDFIAEKLDQLPQTVEAIILTQEDKVKQLAKKYRDAEIFFFLGRGINTATAYEGRLKLMEIAYVPSIAFPAGESKHGPISLIEPGFPVVFICPRDGQTHKTLIGNIQEMKARGASIISIVEEGDEEIKAMSDDYVEVPKGIPEVLSPIPFVIPLQLLAYYMAVEKGLNPDTPRNLAKSVTVK